MDSGFDLMDHISVPIHFDLEELLIYILAKNSAFLSLLFLLLMFFSHQIDILCLSTFFQNLGGECSEMSFSVYCRHG